MIQYFLENLWLAWLLVSLLCLVLELTNGDFFIMCFAIGGVAAAIVSAFSDSFTLQVIVFAVVSALSIFFVRPFALKYLHKNKDNRVSNADAIIGRTGKVTEPIAANGYGRVKVDGDSWKAVAANNLAIEEGTTVRIVALNSIIVTVERAE
jgi:Membrane protein implicated in regulation of membrane protease activity